MTVTGREQEQLNDNRLENDVWGLLPANLFQRTKIGNCEFRLQVLFCSFRRGMLLWLQ